MFSENFVSFHKALTDKKVANVDKKTDLFTMIKVNYKQNSRIRRYMKATVERTLCLVIYSTLNQNLFLYHQL